MSQTPATTRKTFPEISSRAWEHPADRTALSALRRLKGFDQILKLMSGMLRERQHRLLYLASAARVGPRQFADLDALLDECVDVLDASAKPELYVMQSPIADAFTIGMGKPFTVITSGLYDLVTHDEMRFVMGHELGHALSGHAVYRTMMMHLLRLARSFGVLPVGGWALRAIVAALLEWQRKSELSGDRAGISPPAAYGRLQSDRRGHPGGEALSDHRPQTAETAVVHALFGAATAAPPTAAAMVVDALEHARRLYQRTTCLQSLGVADACPRRRSGNAG